MPDINILINAVDRASAPIKAVGGAVDNLAKKSTSAATGGVSRLAGVMGTALKVGAITGVAALGGLAVAVAKTGIDFDNMKQQAQIAFSTMLGDGEKAKLFLDDLQRFAAATPFDFPELLQASQRLLAMGFAAEDVKPTLTAIGDAVAGLGGSSETVGRVATALGQIQAKGKASAEEMMQLTEAGIPAWQMLADAIGVSVPEAMKLVEKGAVSAEQTIDAVVAGMNANFGGMMEKQSQTFGGLVSTIKDTFTQISGTVMQPIFELLTKGLGEVVKITSTPEFSAGVQRFAEWLGDATQKLVNWTISIWPSVYSAISGVYEVFRLLITGDFRGGIFGLTQDDPIVIALTAVHDGFIAIRDFVINELPNWKEKWQGWAVAIGGWIGDAAAQLGTQLNVWWTALSQWLTDNLPAFVQKLTEWASAAWQWIVDAAGVVGGYLGDWYIAIATWLGANIGTFVAKLGEWAAVAWQWIVDAAAELPAKLVEWYGVISTWLTSNEGVFAEGMRAFGAAGGNAMAEGFVKAALDNPKWVAIMKASMAFVTGGPLAAAKELGPLFGGGINTLPDTHPEEPGSRNGPQLFPDTDSGNWLDQWFQRVLPLIPHLVPGMPPGTFAPQSFAPTGPGQNLLPAMAGNTINNTFYIEQMIGANNDIGGARAGAEAGIREALINRKLHG